MVADVQHIHPRLQKAINRMPRRAHDRLVLVERCVQHHRHSRELAEIRNQLIIPRVHFTRDCLQSTRSIDVSHRRNLRAPLRLYLINHQHSWSRMRLLEIVPHVLFKNRRSERPKRLALLYALVESVFHIRPPRIDDNRTIAQRARAKLHASPETIQPQHHRQCPEPRAE